MTRSTITPIVLIAASLLFSISKNLLADDEGTQGSVTYLFDGGTLQCTFGQAIPDQAPNVAMIVFPASVDKFAKRSELTIDHEQEGSIVLVVDANGKFVQLTKKSLADWAKARISEMAGRSTSLAESAFVATVVHTISTGTPIELWASNAQASLESGHWNKLFDPTPDNDAPTDADPFK